VEDSFPAEEVPEKTEKGRTIGRDRERRSSKKLSREKGNRTARWTGETGPCPGGGGRQSPFSPDEREERSLAGKEGVADEEKGRRTSFPNKKKKNLPSEERRDEGEKDRRGTRRVIYEKGHDLMPKKGNYLPPDGPKEN